MTLLSNRLEGAIGGRRAALDQYLRFFDDADSAAIERNLGLDGEGATSQQARGTSSGILDHWRSVSIAGATRVAATAEFESYEDAIGIRDRIADAIGELMPTADDAVFAALQGLQRALVATLPRDLEKLPRVRRLRLPSVRTSIALAYELYGDVEREPEIVALNRPPHPAFLNPAEEVEVLVHG